MPAEAQTKVEPRKILTKRDITKSWWLWYISCEVSNSFERMQSVAFCISMIPILQKLYKTKEELSEALTRHLQFFNTQGIWGGIIHGITIALEEQRARGEEIDDATITGIKAGLMGPFAGIGDTIDWATWLPIVCAFFVPFAKAGSWFAGIGPVLIIGAITCVEGYLLYHLGYSSGTKSATQILKAGWIQQLILGASILGIFMMGGLSATLVNVTTPLKITMQGLDFSIQEDLFDQIIPGLLPLVTVWSIFQYIEKGKNSSYLKAILWVLLIGFVLGAIGVL